MKKEVLIAVLLFLAVAVFYIFLPELSAYLWFKIAVIASLIVLAGYLFINCGFIGLVFVAICLFLAFFINK